MESVKIKCPYCDFSPWVDVAIKTTEQKIVCLCPLEDGGCDRDFVVSYSFKFVWHCQKIEGTK